MGKLRPRGRRCALGGRHHGADGGKLHPSQAYVVQLLTLSPFDCPFMSAVPQAIPSDAPLIELDRASVTRGQVRVLHELSLSIAMRQHTAILAPNGCGKSSF